MFFIEDLAKGLVDTWILSVVPQGLALIDFHHPRQRDRRFRKSIPTTWRVVKPLLGIVTVDLEKIPDRLDHRVQIGLGHGVRNDHIAVRFPEGQILITQHIRSCR